MSSLIARENAEFLNLRRLPACLNVQQVAALLGRHEEQVYIIIHGGLLKPLGNPQRGSVKLFPANYILELLGDRVWLEKVQRMVSRRHAEKSEKSVKI